MSSNDRMGNSTSNNNNNYRKRSPGKRVVRVKSARSLGPPRIVEYTHEQARLVQVLKKRKFEYDTLVFGGGGAKGVAYYGALQVLNDIGLLENVSRFAGTSAGAIMAYLLSLGLSPKEVYELHKQMKTEWFMDAAGGKCCLLPNLVTKLGWNPSKKTTKALTTVLRAKHGRDDITFLEMYQIFGAELCIVASNLSTMTVEYFHPKTTPDMSVIKAVRASMSIPFLMQPVTEGDHLYVDGGLICNFPVHAFDGWFLSMKEEDSFHIRLSSQTDPFEGTNKTTLGLDLEVGDDTAEKVRRVFPHHGPKYPDTKLARKREEKARERREGKEASKILRRVGQHFADLVKNSKMTTEQTVKIDDLQTTFKKSVHYTDGEYSDLTVINNRVHNVFATVKKDFIKEEISFDEYLSYMRRKGASAAFGMPGKTERGLQKVETFGQFGIAMLKTMSKISMFHVSNEANAERTITVSAGYVDTTDFEMEEQDREYLVHQGIWACLDFLMSKGGEEEAEKKEGEDETDSTKL